ncbi:complex I subunit 4 family protein [Metabacillus idriensis]|uniref:complex I subunit 4 family protein n=1 Tax=Metabacillus idriensis TaxID=324768 RepID=UPI00174DDB7D|nr:NADH-quinone oxidoreductase subunit M [Metabacillus idriensis]
MTSILLTALVFSPVLGIIVLAFMNKDQETPLKLVGFLATLPAVLLSGILFAQYQLGSDLARFAEKHRWIAFGQYSDMQPGVFTVDYELALDGFSLIMVLLTSILAALAAAASVSIKKNWKSYFMLLLLLEVGMLGVFMAQNLILFFIFFEITLIPMFFLIGKWGFMAREKAAYQFLLYNGLGSAILLIVIILLFSKTGTTNIDLLGQLLNTPDVQLIGPISDDFKLGLLIALIVAFGVKLPIFPLHTWMLRVHVQAPPPIVMLHSGILLKIGAFGLMKFGLGLFPDEFSKLSTILIVLGLVNLLYGAFLALIQNELRMVLAYSSISHMGIVLIGLGALNEAGIQGAIFQVVSHGLISALLFFLVGVLLERTQTTQLDQLSGLAKAMPLAAGFLLAGAMASLGLPGMSGFISELTAFMGVFDQHPELGAIGTIGIILTAAYLLRAVLSITFGSEKKSDHLHYDMKWYEIIPVTVLLFFIILIGVYPNGLSVPLQLTIETIMKGIGG